MPSRGNPNVPNKQRKTAGRAKVKKRSATNGISKNPRGTARSSVLHPTSGPLAPLSGKKARKVEKAKNNARRRALEQAMKDEGEVEMTDAPKTTKAKTKSAKEAGDKMEVDAIA
ncbi:uncharacterized protein L3040_007324 [Drepanopeziza brunnea f. sp. 'multigermtubi']|uniref:uncharacterized protein n=1 Tax=Drepanopeziza brunnea f. sp. 'multigermtubi' TaxID=698441 RepID=UPI0023850D30|nr:hypothetical protein L3040_007324 [Drepanopeziza brunnea f. sp. 'multigermtubi']